MGSSFSDLDDGSISRSAMEEALAREMNDGKGSSLGVAGRLGGLWKNSTTTTTTGSGGGSSPSGSKKKKSVHR